MANFLGKDAKAYFNATPLTAASASATAVVDFPNILDNITDVTQNLSTDEADITTRANNGWSATAATLKNGSVDFQMVWKVGDAGFTAVQAAFTNSTEIACVFLDDLIATSGSQGISGNFTVTNFTRNEALREAIKVSVTLKPSSYTTWLTI